MHERETERLMAAPDLDMGEYKDGVYRPPSGKKKHKWRPTEAD